MPVTHSQESIPVAEVVENFLNSVHQSGATPSEIIEGVMRAFNGKDGIVIRTLDENVDVRDLALKVESDLNRVKCDLVSFGRSDVGA